MLTIITSSITKRGQTNKKNLFVQLWNKLNHIDDTPQYIASGALVIQGHPDVAVDDIIRFNPGIKFKVTAWSKVYSDRTLVNVVGKDPMYDFEIKEINTHQHATLERESEPLYIEY